MAQWLQDWAQVLSAFGTILMMFAWVFYAQFAIVSYLQQRRARIAIDQTADRSLNTKFVVVNLSEQPVYISCVMIAVRSGDEEKITRVDTYSHFLSRAESDSPQQLESELRHGTLGAGDLLMLGGSDRLLSWLLDSGNDEDFEAPRDERLREALSKIDWFDIRIMAMSGNDDKVIASRRRFEIEEKDEDISIIPPFSQTQHFNSWWTRKTAQEWSQQCMNC